MWVCFGRAPRLSPPSLSGLVMAWHTSGMTGLFQEWLQSEHSLITKPSQHCCPEPCIYLWMFPRRKQARNINHRLKTPALGFRRRAFNPTVSATVLQDLRYITASIPFHSLLLQPCKGREVPTYNGNWAARIMEAQSLTLLRNTEV